MSNVGEVFGNLVTGNIFGAFKSMVNESPQENIREAVVDILNGKKVEENREKLCTTITSKAGGLIRAASIMDWNEGRRSSVAVLPGSTYSTAASQPLASQ